MTDFIGFLKDSAKILDLETQNPGRFKQLILDVRHSLPGNRGASRNQADGIDLGKSAGGQAERVNSPNFFIVGAPKAGTSSLANILGSHPEIYISPIKEPHYFSDDIRLANFRNDYRAGSSFDVKKYLKKQPLPNKHIAFIEDEASYLALFREVRNERAIGELSTGYLYSSTAAENLSKFNANARIVMILRQPVARAYSHYLMNLRELWDSNSSFIDALERDFASPAKGWGRSHLYVELGLYSAQVVRYLERFPEGQVKICLYEDFVSDPVKLIKDLCTFLSIDSSAVSNRSCVSELENVSALPQYKVSSKLLPVLNSLKRRIGALLPGTTKTWIRHKIMSSNNVPVLRQDEFEHAMRYFDDDIRKLSFLIKRDLLGWRQPSK